eukprot:scaffold134061_cov35-Tisochrysis_lutea.AAC.1
MTMASSLPCPSARFDENPSRCGTEGGGPGGGGRRSFLQLRNARSSPKMSSEVYRSSCIIADACLLSLPPPSPLSLLLTLLALSLALEQPARAARHQGRGGQESEEGRERDVTRWPPIYKREHLKKGRDGGGGDNGDYYATTSIGNMAGLQCGERLRDAV